MYKDGEGKREEPARDHQRSADFKQICKHIDLVPDHRNRLMSHIDVTRDAACRIKALLDADDRISKEQAVLELTNLIRHEILNAVADIFETEHQKRRHLDEMMVLNRITLGWQFPAYSMRNESAARR
jgi:chromatin segregation and condensation protein Rec8/ScpA/Scc1 (kleisin family)